MLNKTLQIINILLLIINGFIFLMPKKPMTGLHSNAAGLVFIIAGIVALVYLLHLILFGVALYYQKEMLLRVISAMIIPLSVLFWYFMYNLTQ